MTQIEPRVVIVIPNYNLKSDLNECLESLKNSEYSNMDVVVVDNASSDDSVNFIESRHPWVKVIAQDQNGGYASALNEGILYSWKSNPEYFLLLNNDTLVPPDTVRELVKTLEKDPDIAIAAPKIIYHDQPEIIFSLGDKIYPWLPLPIRFGKQKKDKPEYDQTLEFDYVFGCALLVRASVFSKIGLFDTSYFMFYEDADFCRRVRDAGFKIVRVGKTIIRHKSSRSVKKEPERMTFFRARNRSRFYKRYRHGPHPILTLIALTFGSIITVMKYSFSRKLEKVRPYLNGAWRGLVDELPEPTGIDDLKEKYGNLLG